MRRPTHFAIPVTPDFTQWKALFPLILLILFLPMMLVSLFFLIRRRHYYPFPSRGFHSLLANCLVCIFSLLLRSLMTIYYAYGGPCGSDTWIFLLVTYAFTCCNTHMQQKQRREVHCMTHDVDE